MEQTEFTAPIQGAVLLVLGGGIDSDGRRLEPYKFYKVAKHYSGKVIIIETKERG